VSRETGEDQSGEEAIQGIPRHNFGLVLIKETLDLGYGSKVDNACYEGGHMSPQKLTVSELARIAGVGPDSIRHYERIGLVPKAERSPAGYRLWTAREVQYLKWVASAKR